MFGRTFSPYKPVPRGGSTLGQFIEREGVSKGKPGGGETTTSEEKAGLWLSGPTLASCSPLPA